MNVQQQSGGSAFRSHTVRKSRGVPSHRGKSLEGISTIATRSRWDSVYPCLPRSFGSAPRPRLVGHPILYVANHLVERDLQSIRNRPNSDRGRIQDPSFHAAQIGPLKSAFGAQPLLRKTRRSPELSSDCADGFLLEVRRLDMSGARLHPEASWWYGEAHKPTAYTPHFACWSWEYE